MLIFYLAGLLVHIGAYVYNLCQFHLMSSANYFGGIGGGRPSSIYDNYDDDKQHAYSAYDGYEDDKYDKLRNEMLGFERTTSPTQTISLLTTVPQNITPANIAGRHAPTRHSLRHSRMIVMNRYNATVPTKSTPSTVRFHKLAKVLVAVQFVLGICICAIAFWIYLFAPSINERHIPYWSGIPLLISGSIAFILVCCSVRKNSRSFLVHSIKILSIFLSTVAGVTCLIASAFALIHLAGLLFMDCVPHIQMNMSCLCTVANTTSLPSFIIQEHHYKDLQCHELNNFFVTLLIASCGGNVIGCLVALWYVYLYWSSWNYYKYTKVETEPGKELVTISSDANGNGTSTTIQ